MAFLTHQLKCWPAFFQAVIDKKKTFEIRRHDRCFALGDILLLWEFDPEPPGRYTGRSASAEITYVLLGGQFGLHKDWIALGIELRAKR